MDNITIDDFKKIDIRIGKILNAERIGGSDKLLKLQVDFGFKKAEACVAQDEKMKTLEQKENEALVEWLKEAEQVAESETAELEKDIRQIVSGIAEFYTPESLIGKEASFVLNLEPRTLRGVESFGMILAASADGKPVILIPEEAVSPGIIVK